jgi:glutaredoxin
MCVMSMTIQFLYFDGCPTSKEMKQTLEEILSEEDVDAQIQLLPVNTAEEAQRVQLPGSPTIRLNGRDPFPVGKRQDWWLGCRMYPTAEGLKGTLTKAMLREALLAAYQREV